jgi:hypothetical protein
LVLQAVNASRGTVSYQIIGNGTGANGTDVFAATGGGWFNSGLYQLSFTLAVATLARLGGQLRDIKYNRVGQLCLLPAVRLGHHLRSNVFHTGRGGTLTSNLLASPTASSAITTANSFTINETITMNSYGPQQYTGHRDPEALHLSSVRQTFGTIPEPPAIIVLLTAIGGIAFIRRRMHG